MKKFLLLALVMLFAGNVFSQPALRLKARKVIRRTAIVLTAAHSKLKETKNYTGDFAKAMAHQRFAKRLFFRRNFVRAAMHSKVARRLAFKVLRDNKAPLSKDLEISEEEQSILDNTSDKELEDELIKDDPKASMKDEDYMDAPLDADVEKEQ